jgi:signal transduction histidine kinase
MSVGPQPAEPPETGTPKAREVASRFATLGRRVVDRLTVGDGVVEHVPPSDVLLAVVLAAPAIAVHAFQPTEGIDHLSVPGLAGFVLLVLVFGVLAWRRVAPTLTMMLAGFGTGAWYLIGHTDGFLPLAVMVALYSVAAYGSRADGVTSLVITEVFVIITFITLMARGEPFSSIQLVVNVLIFVGIWVLGDRTRVRRELVQQLRAQAEQAERSRELATELAVADERGRIARELHDVVAHTVSVMVVQAGAGRRIAQADPARAVTTLGAIEEVGREALADLRRMVGVLREENGTDDLAPQPSLEDLDDLVQRLASAGLPVQLVRRGEPRALPSGIELSAYRIVQEALTNVMKHAGVVRSVVVTLRFGEGALVVEVDDDGRGAAGAASEANPGSGVVGMRERVAVFDGRLQVGPRPEGGYRVRAVLPLPPDQVADQPADDALPDTVRPHEPSVPPAANQRQEVET